MTIEKPLSTQAEDFFSEVALGVNHVLVDNVLSINPVNYWFLKGSFGITELCFITGA